MIKYAVKLKNGNYLDDNNIQDVYSGHYCGDDIDNAFLWDEFSRASLFAKACNGTVVVAESLFCRKERDIVEYLADELNVLISSDIYTKEQLNILNNILEVLRAKRT